MKRIALRWLGALLLSITLAAPALAAGKHLINGIDANYPPFAYVDETGKPAGFDVDSMNWIAKKMGFTVEHKPMDWDGIIPALLAKKIDMVCSGMSISPERKAQANFSDPYWTIRKIFITKKGSKVTEDQIYNGKWYSPLTEALVAFANESNKYVTGSVKLKLYKGNIIPAGTTSPYSLYSEELVTFGESDYNQAQAAGFINIWGLPTQVEALREQGKL